MAMTRVDFHYCFTEPFNERWLVAVEALHSVYGLQSVRLTGAGDGLEVSVDATRLTPADLDRRLLSAGLPVRRA